MIRKRMLGAVALALITALMLSGCVERGEETDVAENISQADKYRFAMVAKDTTNPYMTHMFTGFKEACEELNAEAMLVGPDSLSIEGQIESIEALINDGVDAIAVAANDREALSPVLNKAITSGIQIVSLDSNVNVEDRMVHIQQAAPDILGRVLVQAADEMIGGEGEMAILTTTETAPNQSQWVAWMKRELEEHPDNYAGIKLVEIAYGMDEYEPSREETARLLENYPELDIIIVPTSVGISAAAEEVTRSGADVLITGLGLPSEMAEYIIAGISPWIYLWNPIDVGYISAYACEGLVSQRITGAIGEILPAGTHGDKRITQCGDGGTEIVVGNPCMFDAGNVSVWREIF